MTRIAITAALSIPLGAAVVPATPAFAATCSGSGCNNTDPKGTGCWDSHAFSLIAGTTGYGDTVQLWWSPDCGTNWAQVDSKSTAMRRIWTELQTGAQTAQYTFSGYIGWAWSDQLYAPTTKADACEQVYETAAHQWGPAECVGQF